MDLAALRTRVRDLAGVQMTEILSDANVDTFINEAYDRLNAAAEWDFCRVVDTTATVASTTVYPTTVERVETATVDDQHLVKRATQDFRRQPTSRSTPRVPHSFAVNGADVEVFPAPDDVYTLTVYGFAAPARLTADTDEPVFDEEFHPAVAYEAAAAIMQAEGDDSQRSEFYLGQVGVYLSLMSRRYLQDGATVVWPPNSFLPGEAPTTAAVPPGGE